VECPRRRIEDRNTAQVFRHLRRAALEIMNAIERVVIRIEDDARAVKQLVALSVSDAGHAASGRG
jgi:hypothetical protein